MYEHSAGNAGKPFGIVCAIGSGRVSAHEVWGDPGWVGHTSKKIGIFDSVEAAKAANPQCDWGAKDVCAFCGGPRPCTRNH